MSSATSSQVSLDADVHHAVETLGSDDAGGDHVDVCTQGPVRQLGDDGASEVERGVALAADADDGLRLEVEVELAGFLGSSHADEHRGVRGLRIREIAFADDRR